MEHRRSASSDDDLRSGQRAGRFQGSPPESPGSATPYDDTRPFMPEIDPSPRDAGGPTARLRVEHGSVDQADIPLEKPTIVIGRRLTCDVVIHDTNVSRQHARIMLGPNGYRIEDTQSSNGTFVNDERITYPHALEMGDIIRIGDAAFTYEAVAAPARPSNPPSDRFAPVVFEPAESSERGGPPATDDAHWVADRAAAREDAEPVVADASIHVADAGAPDDRAPHAGAVAGEPDAGVRDDTASPTGAVLGEVRRDLGALAEAADRLGDRVGALADALDGIGPGVPRLDVDPDSEGAVAMVELRRILAELRTDGDPERATAAANLLDQVNEQPRDIELLLGIARQAPLLAAIARRHAQLTRIAPLLEDVLAPAPDLSS